MSTNTLRTNGIAIVLPVSRPPSRRLADALKAAWAAWRRRRDERREMDMLLQLDDRTLRDIGASAQLRAQAEALQGGAYHRMGDLLR